MARSRSIISLLSSLVACSDGPSSGDTTDTTDAVESTSDGTALPGTTGDGPATSDADSSTTGSAGETGETAESDGGETDSTGEPASCSAPMHTPSGPDGAGGCWPGPDNTGVPAGIALRMYDGPGGITENGTVLDGMIIEQDVRVYAADV